MIWQNPENHPASLITSVTAKPGEKKDKEKPPQAVLHMAVKYWCFGADGKGRL